MTFGGLLPSGLVSEDLFIQSILVICLFGLLGLMFLIGRFHGLRQRGTEQLTVDALRQVGAEQEQRNAELRQEREEIFREGLRAQTRIKRWEEVRSDHGNLNDMRKELDEFEREESNRIDELERRRAEKARLLGDVEVALAKFPHEIFSEDGTWEDFLAERKEEYDRLRQQIDDLRKEMSIVDATRSHAMEEVTRLENSKSRLKEEIRSAEELLERINNDQIESLKPLNERILDELTQVRDKIEGAKAELRDLEAVLEEKRNDITSKTASLESLETIGSAILDFPEGALPVSVREMPDTARSASGTDKLGAFRVVPDCLMGFDDVRSIADEDELLEALDDALINSGLKYPKQIVRAFHTALKVNDLAPLTVLSGLSGTGKSQLPRAYTRFFGIYFLHVPVEPGWDSPQDLLGFYDFVAERYRPTDRARALGHFDNRFSEEVGITSDRNWDERMLIVLLDEMNLARTEYYFSEFLSRLEMRGPRTAGSGDRDGQSEAMIAIDLPYAENEKPKHLFIPHNVLWVGTLNEDETTQALSDKVLDRANSIRFAPPDPATLHTHSRAPANRIQEANGYLPYEKWLQWSERGTTVADSEQSEQVGETLKGLATLMQNAGRGFGYRIAQSIRAYVERYPGQDWRVPMIDQINMRLLPKLAGAEMSDCEDTLAELKRLSEQDLGDPDFAEALQKAMTDSEASQIFSWPGYTYEGSAH